MHSKIHHKTDLALLLLFLLGIFFSLRFYEIKFTAPTQFLNETLQWQDASLSEKDLLKIFKHPFTYLDKGCQTLVFESYDHKYVLKVTQFSPSYKFLKRISHPSIKSLSKYLEKKEDALHLSIKSLHHCVRHFEKESQILFLSIGKPIKNFSHLRLIDNWGFSHRIDTSRSIVILQKKGKRFDELFLELAKKREIETAKNSLKTLFDLIEKERVLGILDKDAHVTRNFGFFDKRVLLIDTAGLMQTTKKNHYGRHIKKIKKTLIPWIEKYFPELKEYAEQGIHHLERETFS